MPKAGRRARLRCASPPAACPSAKPKYPRGEHGCKPLDLWVVHVREIDPPEKGDPVEWILLTDLPCDTFEAACRIAEYYAARWVIEEYHKVQKTGCSIELPQFTKTQRLEPMIGLLSVVAVQLLKLRDAARREDLAHRPATDIMPRGSVRMLSAWRWGEAARQPTVREFLLALARLGGHQNRKSDGLPGWITLWRGWTKLQSMIQGAQTAKRIRCG